MASVSSECPVCHKAVTGKAYVFVAMDKGPSKVCVECSDTAMAGVITKWRKDNLTAPITAPVRMMISSIRQELRAKPVISIQAVMESLDSGLWSEEVKAQLRARLDM